MKNIFSYNTDPPIVQNILRLNIPHTFIQLQQTLSFANKRITVKQLCIILQNLPKGVKEKKREEIMQSEEK